jgi:hypothetical protein
MLLSCKVPVLRPNEGPASAWIDQPTTIAEENGNIPREVFREMWFATPLLYDGKEQEIESGIAGYSGSGRRKPELTTKWQSR